MEALETPPVEFTTSTSDAASAASEASGFRHKLPMNPSMDKNGIAKKLQWSLLEAKIELMREKANLVREQVLTQKELTRGQVLKNRLMELEIEKIEGEKEEPKRVAVRGQNIGIDPGIREEPPDKRPRRQAARGSSVQPTATATVTIAPVPTASAKDLDNLRSAIQQAQTSSARATPATPQIDTRESSVVPENLNSIVESINFYEASGASTSQQDYGQDSMDSSGFDASGMVQKIEPADEFSMDYGDGSGYMDPNQYLQSLQFGSQAMASPSTSTAGTSSGGAPNAAMDMDAETWRVTQFEPFLNQTPAGAELVQVLSQGISLSEKQRICLVRMLSGYLRNVCKNPARGPDVPERKLCVDKLFDAYPQLGIDSNKEQWHNSQRTGWVDYRVYNETRIQKKKMPSFLSSLIS